MSRNRNYRSFGYSPLEDRRLLAVSSVFDSDTGILSIFGDSTANIVNVQQSGTFLDITGDLNAQYDAADVSLIQFFGAAGDDFFENFTDIDTLAVGHAGNDELRTAGGTDRLFGGDGDDLLVSTGGNDRLLGNDGVDVLFGGDGDDVIFGLQGDDELNGEAGDDTLVAGFGDDIVFGGNGNDLVFGHFGFDQIYGGAGNDRLFGQDDGDFIQGDDGDDVVRGGRGVDELNGNNGNDRILGDEDNDTIYGNDGNDIIFAGAGDDIVRGGAGNDLLFANSGDDDVRGEAGNDILRGNAGNDTLDGGDNADRIAGDDGDDFIIGGGANDTVLGDDGNDTIVADSNDRARGGAGNDILQLSDLSNDIAIFSGNYSNYVVTLSGDTLVVHDTTGADGQDLITGADSFQFADGSREARAEVTRRVYIQPIIVSDSNGSNTAEFFGNAEQEFEIKRLIDEIYLQAGVDVEWLDARSTNNTFFNEGTGSGTRTQSDLNTIITNGDNSGVGNSDPLVLDIYFVNRVPGFGTLSENSANGLAFVGGNGVAMHTGDNLPGFSGGQSVVARVAAHEIAHNFGLEHVNDGPNLMDAGDELTNSQISTILNSSFAQTSFAGSTGGDSGGSGNSGGTGATSGGSGSTDTWAGCSCPMCTSVV